jgi:hypothetical protein
LQLFRTLEQGQQPVDPLLNQFVNSIKIEPRKDRATLTATLPPEVLKRLTSTRP